MKRYALRAAYDARAPFRNLNSKMWPISYRPTQKAAKRCTNVRSVVKASRLDCHMLHDTMLLVRPVSFEWTSGAQQAAAVLSRARQ